MVAAAPHATIAAARAALLDLTLPPCAHSVVLAVRSSGGASTPRVGCTPACASPLQLLMLLDFDAAPLQPGWAAVHWMVCNARLDGAGCHGGDTLQPYVPVTTNGAPRRVVLLCCVQAAALCAATVTRTWASERESPPAVATPPPVRIAPVDFARDHGLRATGAHSDVTIGECYGGGSADAGARAPSGGSAWVARWHDGGRFLEWLLLGAPMAGWPQFADAAAQLERAGGLGEPVSEEAAAQFAALATAWEMAAQLRAAAAAGDAAARSAVAGALQALLEAAQRGESAALGQIEARFSSERSQPPGDDVLASCTG
jgi:hypothetical protein